MNETRFKTKVIKYLRDHYEGIWVYKSSDKFVAGIPDLIICKDGLFYAIELKVTTNKPTKLQSFVIRKIRDAGGKAGVAWNIADVERIINS